MVVDDSPDLNSALDTLAVQLLELEIRAQEAKVEETSFWTRLIPRIHLSASFGMHDLMFIDPASFTPYILPRDSYRLTISLSLNDVLVSSSHTQAILELEKLREMLSIRRIQYARECKLLNQQLAALHDQLESFEKELAIVQELLRFNQLRFEQGKIEFDALARTKLELLGLQRSIQRVRQQQFEVRLKLGTQ
jgi:outer membrane protein TolC